MKQLAWWIRGWSIALFLWQGSVWATASVNIPQDDPVKMVESLSHTVIQKLEAQREALKGNPEEIKAFANQYVLPYIDTKKMARYVMGRYWRMATPEQQQAFVAAFEETLLRSYANSMLNLKITKFEITDAKPEGRGRMIIGSKVTQADGNVTQVQYRAYQNKKTHQWLLYDVVIEGVSMLLNYRKTYASAFQQKGIDGVIAELQAKNRQFEKAA